MTRKIINTIEDIESNIDFEYAPQNTECINCNNEAFGVIYYWCGNPECCSPPQAFFCKECLLEMYRELNEKMSYNW